VGDIPRAAVLVGWQASPWGAVARKERIQLAGLVLSDRLQKTVRQDHGLTYALQTTFSPSQAYPGVSLVSVSLLTAPDSVDEVISLVRRSVEKLADAGLSETEIEPARRHLCHISRKALRDPRYWVRMLAELDHRGLSVPEVAAVEDRFASHPAREASAAFREIVKESGRLTVVGSEVR